LTVIISKYSKSYDTADGSEQQFGASPRRGTSSGAAAKARWEDDGGPLVGQTVVPLAAKPVWSVLSLRDLNEAIRRTNDPRDPANVQQESRRVERDRLAAAALEDARLAAAARARRNRYRNPWEHT
jgi:hypothetical protein